LSFLSSINWIWPAIALAFSIGVALTQYWYKRRNRTKGRVNQEYFKGLNFLLNEEPDKAIEVFIKALEVDSETVELHLALGGLFRRKGQVDRATRIHQNLIARPSLTEEQRLQAIYELAEDYYKAGLLDRAENLFLELKDTATYREIALKGLSRIYQQEKEWKNAIEVTKARRNRKKGGHTKQVSHYWCELAERAIEEKDFEIAAKCLKSALGQDRAAARAVLLKGELDYQQKNYRKALLQWQSLSVSSPKLAGLVVEKVIDCFGKTGDDAGLKVYLLEAIAIPKSDDAFEVWRMASFREFGESSTMQQIVNKLQKEGLSGPAARYLHQKGSDGEIDQKMQRQLLNDFLDRAKDRNIEYTCVGCGFDVKAMYWLCPNCGEWDSFS
jgi:lipopolysaccharide biosynthesis regulator YciM